MSLDLRELDRQLAGLVDDLTGRSVESILIDAGLMIRDAWRGNIETGDLILTGQYHDSLAVEVLDSDEKRVRVQIGTDARDEHGFPYPAALEFGTSQMTPKPAGTRAFDSRRRRVVKDVAAGLERKVRSRARK